MIPAMIFVVGAVAVGLALAPPASGVALRLPGTAQLVEAVRSGDDVEVERVAARLGAVRLERVAERGRREERLAALRGLAVVPDGWALLVETAHLCGDREPDVAEAAAVTARRIAESLSPETVERDEVPRDVPRRAAVELLAQAARGELRPSVRVSAIGAAAALRAVARLDEAALARLLRDAEPQVRRAAAEGLAGAVAPEAERALGAALADDASAEVAAAAAATLCRDVPLTSGKPSAERVAARLEARARTRLRALAVDERLALADRLDLVPCLRVGVQPADQQVLDRLARRGPEPLRRRARALGGH
jgi:hypothetical protein